MQRIHTGKRSLQGKLERYAQRFDLLEFRPDPDAAPRGRTLRSWRKHVPPSFVFSVVMPPIIGELRSTERFEEVLAWSLETARILESPILVLPTPASVTPTAANRNRLKQLVERIPREVIKIAWEPAGLWEPADAVRIARDLELVLVRDAASEALPPGPVVYTRLRGLGEHRRLSAARLDKVIANIRGRRDAYVIIETEQAQQVAKSLISGMERTEGGRTRVVRPRGVAQTLRAEDEEQE